jgi:hypothetical protein
MTVCARQIAELTEIDLKNLGPAAVELEVLSGKSFGKTIHQMSDVREKTSDQKFCQRLRRQASQNRFLLDLFYCSVPIGARSSLVY